MIYAALRARRRRPRRLALDVRSPRPRPPSPPRPSFPTRARPPTSAPTPPATRPAREARPRPRPRPPRSAPPSRPRPRARARPPATAPLRPRPPLRDPRPGRLQRPHLRLVALQQIERRLPVGVPQGRARALMHQVLPQLEVSVRVAVVQRAVPPAVDRVEVRPRAHAHLRHAFPTELRGDDERGVSERVADAGGVEKDPEGPARSAAASATRPRRIARNTGWSAGF